MTVGKVFIRQLPRTLVIGELAPHNITIIAYLEMPRQTPDGRS